jgi:aminoglycoside phosphotransferase (APT) family kinase protein
VTILFDVAWTVGGVSHREGVVVRMAPTDSPLFPDYDLAIQHECMRAVAEVSAVPVPAVIAVDDEGRFFGRPSYVMSRIEGRVASDYPPYAREGWLFDLAPADQTAIYRGAVETLASIHAIDVPEKVLNLLDRSEYGPQGLQQQLSYQRYFLDWASRGEGHPVLTPVFAWLESNRPQDEGPHVLNWGDPKLPNLIYEGVSPVGVLDWEMATIGPPEVDLAHFLVNDRYVTIELKNAPLAGAPTREEVINWYETAAGRPISSEFAWYEAFASFRFGVILIRTFERLVDNGTFTSDTDLVLANRPAAMAAEIIAGGA